MRDDIKRLAERVAEMDIVCNMTHLAARDLCETRDAISAKLRALARTDHVEDKLGMVAEDRSKWSLHDRVEFALRDAGFDYDEAFNIASVAAAPAPDHSAGVGVNLHRKAREMTRPTDAAIARAFWKVDGFIDLDRHERRILEIITAEARKIDAEAGGTARQTEEMCGCGYVRGSLGCIAMEKKLKELATSPEHVQIPAESDHVAPFDRCPKCTAHMPVGQTCGGVNCGLRGKE